MNAIKDWSFDKPVEPGYYLICYGDIEVAENIQPLNITLLDHVGPRGEWNSASTREVSTWSNSWKFARLSFGSETNKKEVKK